MKFSVICLFLSSLPAIFCADITNGTLSVMIVTTAGCPDTQNFLLNGGIKDTYDKYSNFMSLDLKAVGRIDVDVQNNTICDGGISDSSFCEENYYQRCALHLLRNDTNKKLAFMICDFTTDGIDTKPDNWQEARRNNCLEKIGLTPKEVSDCAKSGLGEQLTLESIVINTSVRQVLKWVPSIVFDGVVDAKLHWKAYADFPNTVCEVFKRNGEDRCGVPVSYGNVVTANNILFVALLAVMTIFA